MNVIRFKFSDEISANKAFEGMLSLVKFGMLHGGLTRVRQEGSSFVFEACIAANKFLPDGNFVISELKDEKYIESIKALF